MPSRFLFDERLFDQQYYCEKMRESRERKARKIEQLKAMLAASRSGVLWITEMPPLEAIPGLELELDGFIGSISLLPLAEFLGQDGFNLEHYRRSILGSVPPGCIIRFSAIPPVFEDSRLDRVRKFIALLFMEQSREALLTQEGEEIKVEIYEAD
ncbi:MAG: hypothetical protein NTW86_14305 [Candidatus Sumerlaeota bacterium]|nr:hypothetical protein [Candidatus Sumerlaeota bacterium]